MCLDSTSGGEAFFSFFSVFLSFFPLYFFLFGCVVFLSFLPSLSTGRLELHPPSTIPLCFIPHGRLGREGHFQFGVVVGAEADICRPNWNTRTDTRACAWLESIDVWPVFQRELGPAGLNVSFSHTCTQRERERRLGGVSLFLVWCVSQKGEREGEGEKEK